MSTIRVPPVTPLVGALVLVAAPLGAQTGAFTASYGAWRMGDSTAAVFTAAVHQPLFGPFGYSIGFTHLDDGPSPTHRTLSGAEVGLTLGSDGHGPYLVGSVGAGVLHRTGALDGLWSAGIGYAIRPFQTLSLALEARYRTEDRDFAGFWRLHPDDRRGVSVAASVALGLGGRRAAAVPTRTTPTATPTRPPTTDTVHELAREGGASDEAARVTTSVVETALDVMGTPYQWGGTSDNGFDCSGLIQYAYGQHGIILPRISRDQMRIGTSLDVRLEALRPGDLLGFSVESTSTITHIGLYVGEGQFIHSTSGGVKLSSLVATDPDSRWWQRRWVAARRVID